jgi:hypothetical protein
MRSVPQQTALERPTRRGLKATPNYKLGEVDDNISHRTAEILLYPKFRGIVPQTKEMR